MRAALPLILLASSAAAQEGAPRIAVMSAFAPEWQALTAVMDGAETEAINGTPFVTGTLEGKPVVAVPSGVSMVNAAMVTQLLLDRFDVSAIVFSGIAGGVDPDLSIGDVVVPAQWGQYLQGVMGREGEDGSFSIPPWMASEFAPFGMQHTVTFGVMRGGLEAPDMRFWFEADPELLALAGEVAAATELQDCSAEAACLSEAPRIVVGGNGVSGPSFIDNAELRGWAFGTFDAQVLDMESAAVAQVAFANEVPFIAFRSLSDLAGGGEGANEMQTFMALAAGNAVEVMRAFVAAMPE